MIPTWFLRSLKDKGLLSLLYKHGCINQKTFILLEVRDKVDALMRQGLSHGQAVRYMAKEIRVSKVTIYSYL